MLQLSIYYDSQLYYTTRTITIQYNFTKVWKIGCIFMRYEKLLEIIAQENNTTPKEVDKEIREAIKSAGLDMPPELFIALNAAKVKDDINNHKPW